MIATECPSRHQLSDYLLGKLPDPVLDDLTRHLEECSHCQSAADELERIPDSLLRRLRGPAPGDWTPPDAELPPLLETVRAIPTSDPAPPHSDDAHWPEQLRDYRLLEKLGEGGMGAVYRARHLRLDLDVALKLLPPERARDKQAASRFEREMRAIGQLQHAHIVRALDAGVIDGTYYLAMELIEGCDASELVRRLGPLAVADACEIVRQAALGLAHAHEHGTIHRDLKPSNLLIDRAGTVRIADLGLALFAQAPVDGERTPASQMLGTLDYLAPELAAGSQANERSDIYALGGTLFKLLSGQTPFPAQAPASPIQTLIAHRDQPPPALGSLRADVPHEVASLVGAMLSKDPPRRPASATEVAAALKPFCDGADLAACVARATSGEVFPVDLSHREKPDSARGASGAQPRINRRALALAAMILVSLGIGVAATVFQQARDDDSANTENRPVPSAAAAKKVGDEQRQWAEKLGLKVEQENSIGMKLTVLPPGKFQMGSTAPEMSRAKALEQQQVPEGWPMHYFLRKVEVEFPQHSVELTRPFLIGTHEVTAGQWNAFVTASGHKRHALGDTERYGEQGFGEGGKPPADEQTAMTFVTWDDATAFCDWLSAKERKTYRLPTEAEWEYACRAGTTTSWFTGDEPASLRDFAWTLQSCGVARDAKTQNSADVLPKPAGGKQPNPFGLYDMTGNAWEWCRDNFRQDYYGYSPKQDPPGPKMLVEGPFNKTKVLRGGGIGFRENESRSATRWFLPPDAVRNYIGFRVVCELPAKSEE